MFSIKTDINKVVKKFAYDGYGQILPILHNIEATEATFHL